MSTWPIAFAEQSQFLFAVNDPFAFNLVGYVNQRVPHLKRVFLNPTISLSDIQCAAKVGHLPVDRCERSLFALLCRCLQPLCTKSTQVVVAYTGQFLSSEMLAQNFDITPDRDCGTQTCNLSTIGVLCLLCVVVKVIGGEVLKG